MRRTRSSTRFRVVATVIVLFVALGLGELGARTIGAELPGWRLIDAEGVIMSGHPTRLWGLKQGRKENAGAFADINSLGLRGGELGPKTPGVPRVMVVGDSTWFGHGVSDADTFSSQLARVFAARGVAIEPINGGVPGYSSEQSRLLMDEVGWALEPDLLLVANLWSDNNYDSFRDQDLLATVGVAARNPLYASHLFRLLVSAVDRAKGGTGAQFVTFTKDRQPSTTGGRRVSLQRYAENLDAMAREAARRGAGVAFVAPCNQGLARDTDSGRAFWDVYFEAQVAIAAHHGVPRIETLPAMKAANAEGGAPLFVDVMHPSERGHGVFATAVADALQAAGWPRASLVATGGVFPAETLVDGGHTTGAVNPGSQQANLLGAERTAGPPVIDGSGKVRPPGAPSQPQPKWPIDGEIVGGALPILLEARGPTGVVGSVRLTKPGSFTVNIRGDLDAIELVVTDARGRVETRNVGRSQGPVNVVMPE